MNQCDGCRRGLPVDSHGIHRGGSFPDAMVCQAERYLETRMIKPRNTLVVVEIIDKAERKVGAITVPANNDCYTEAEVIAVGPGNVSANGGRSETFDLKPGQRVWVKHKKKLQQGHLTRMEDEGLPYTVEGDTRKLFCFEQNSIIGILAEPGDLPPVKPAASKIVLN